MSSPEKTRYNANVREILFALSPESGKRGKMAPVVPCALKTGDFTADAIVDSDAMWITLMGYPHRLDNPKGCPHSPQYYYYHFYKTNKKTY